MRCALLGGLVPLRLGYHASPSLEPLHLHLVKRGLKSGRECHKSVSDTDELESDVFLKSNFNQVKVNLLNMLVYFFFSSRSLATSIRRV
jgi:hypothetical protein